MPTPKVTPSTHLRTKSLAARRALCIVVVACASALPTLAIAAERPYPFSLRDTDGTIVAVNEGEASVTALIKFEAGTQLSSEKGEIIAVTVPPGGSQQVTRLIPNTAVLPPSGTPGYSSTSKFAFGSLTAPARSDYAYSLPFKPGSAHEVAQAEDNPEFSHSGADRYAVDFEMAEGTPVHAARSGVVVYTCSQFREAGVTPDMLDKANAIFIEHNDGTVAVYGHLAYNGVTVTPGQRVRAGTHIGYSGNTGFSSGPHLHFSVTHMLAQGGDIVSQTIPIKFQENTGLEAAHSGVLMTSMFPGSQVEEPNIRRAPLVTVAMEDSSEVVAVAQPTPGSLPDEQRGGSAGAQRAAASFPAGPTSAQDSVDTRAGLAVDKGAASISAFALFWIALGKWSARRNGAG